ncbi:unnamed protein product [Rotaria socialis]|uniref:NAD(P)(+)--arginine ADP-ribosyltransferase n=1 Tax=Rotaria socialis TaxID=392032 RepID=A0A818S808_9BILA|nr:unnamed protein product [Rotaria socialis]CAF3371205.1 unnamed protein product [Rotaria socialis]CAF3388729.1 unnamed protein product [Rotaria socialis]CAF3437105.1 unnamed protein product [Rotaria socialis]CAF3669020.1 unnamed protein product [Rotaria socialis]
MLANQITNTTHRFYDVADEPCVFLLPIEGFNKKPLVTLEEATQPLIPIVPRICTFVHIAKSRATNSADNLTRDESAAIALYTMEWQPTTQSLYYILNTTLRQEDRNKLKPWFSYLKLILTGLSHLQSTSHRVYRGVRNIIEREREKYTVGKRIVWWGFSSCSKKREVTETDNFLGESGTRTLFIIDCTTGKNIEKHSYFTKETEILLLPTTTVEVTGYEQKEDNLHIIYLQEVKSIPGLIEPISSESERDVLKVASKGRPVAFARRRSISEANRDVSSKFQELITRHKNGCDVFLREIRLKECDVKFIVEQLVMKKRCPNLFLRENGLKPEGAFIISEALRDNDTLQMLFIAENKLGDEGVKFLARALSGDSNTTLKQLNLARNSITDQGVKYIAKMLESNKVITHLWLGENQITDQGLQLLCEVLTNQNRTLQELSLEWNKFRSNATVQILVNMFHNNKSLVKLNLTSCKLPTSATRQLKDLAEKKENFELLIN